MLLPALDKFLVGKEIGKNYHIELSPDEAFGQRKKEFIRTMPMSVFVKQKINPQPGMVFSFDNMPARISAVSGGRVIVDFNNPLAGKYLVYDLSVKNKISDDNEKISTLIEFFLKRPLEFKLEVFFHKILNNYIPTLTPAVTAKLVSVSTDTVGPT